MIRKVFGAILFFYRSHLCQVILTLWGHKMGVASEAYVKSWTILPCVGSYLSLRCRGNLDLCLKPIYIGCG